MDRRCLSGTLAVHRVTGADPSLLGPLQQSVDALAARHDNDLIMRTRRALYVLVMQGKGSMTSVADLMGMRRRTLNRRLALSGTSISEQLEDVKSHIARQLVADTTMSMIEIASTLELLRRWHLYARLSPMDGHTPQRMAQPAETESLKHGTICIGHRDSRSTHRTDIELGG